MDSNWIIINLQNALDTWNSKLMEIIRLLNVSPAQFKDGKVFSVIETLNRYFTSIGLSLLVLVFVIGVLRSTMDFRELKRPERAIGIFIRFALSKYIVSNSLNLALRLFEFVGGISENVISSLNVNVLSNSVLPSEIKEAVDNITFLESVPVWIVTLLGSIFITVIAYILIFTVYGRFFRVYFFTAMSPIPLSFLANEESRRSGIMFLRNYIATLLEGIVIVISVIIFSILVTSKPVLADTGNALGMVWSYIAEFIFNALILVGTIRISDRVIREVLGV